MSVKNIFQKPTYVKKAGNIYPIRLIDWDEFESCLDVLMLSKKHIEVTVEEDVPLLIRILIMFGQNNDDSIINIFIKLFNLITRTDSFNFDENNAFFINKNNQIIDETNYEDVRSIVLHQNIIIEPKIYKNKLMRKWAEKVLEVRRKNAPNVTLEDMITTVAALSGKDYETLEKYSIYQLKSEFARWNKIKQFEAQTNLLGNPFAASDVKFDYFAEYLDLYTDPYADVFKNKNDMKINKVFSE